VIGFFRKFNIAKHTKFGGVFDISHGSKVDYIIKASELLKTRNCSRSLFTVLDIILVDMWSGVFLYDRREILPRVVIFRGEKYYILISMIYIHNCITCHVDVTKRVKSFLSRSVFVMLIFLRKMRKRYILMVLLQIFIQAFTSLLNSSKQFLLAYSALALFYPCIMFLKNILV